MVNNIELSLIDLYSNFLIKSEVILSFEKLQMDGYWNFYGYYDQMSKSSISNSMKQEDAADDLHDSLIELYDNTKLPQNEKDAQNSFSENVRMIMEYKNLILKSNISKTNRDAVIFYLFIILKTKTRKKKFLKQVFEKIHGMHIANEINNSIIEDSFIWLYDDSGYLRDPKIKFIKISDISDFITKIGSIKMMLDSGTRVFYRGQSDINYLFQPSVNRTPNLERNEARLYKEIRVRCPNEFIECRAIIEYLTKMQHYSLPTRLLDITSNPLVALFFACQSNPAKDGEVILVKSEQENVKFADSDTVDVLASLSKLSQDDQSKIKSSASNYSDLYRRASDDSKRKRVISNFNNLEEIGRLLHEIKIFKPGFRDIINPIILSTCLIVNPFKSNPRVMRQDGLFILYGTEKERIKSLRLTDISERILILLVQSSYKSRFLKELDLYSISKASLFPEIDSVASYLRESTK